MSFRRFIFLWVSGFAVLGNVYSDGVLVPWFPRDLQGLKPQSFDSARKWSGPEILEKNLAVQSWPDAYLLFLAAQQHRQEPALLEGLIAQLSNPAKAELILTSKLVIWERIVTHDLFFEGKGFCVRDDLFTVCGRANWLLRTMTRKNFGYVKPEAASSELLKLQQRWTAWLHKEPVEEYNDPSLTRKGIKEIKSVEALEAMIVSLQPSLEKEAFMKECLKKTFGLDKFPDDTAARATLCNPDTYVHSYLSTLTGIKEKYDAAWWKNWWDQNRNRLKWDSTKDIFEASEK